VLLKHLDHLRHVLVGRRVRHHAESVTDEGLSIACCS
jgi:hypothetical protein